MGAGVHRQAQRVAHHASLRPAPRRPDPFGTPVHRQLVALQRSAGNRAVAQLLELSRTPTPLPTGDLTVQRGFGDWLRGVGDTVFGAPRIDVVDPQRPTTDELRAMGYAQICEVLDGADQTHVLSLHSDSPLLDHIFSSRFSPGQSAQIAVRLLLRTPGNVVEGRASRDEAIRLLALQIGNDKAVARRLLEAGVRVVIVPRNVGMTTLPEFAAQSGQLTFDGRSWDSVRGLGGMNTAITEENLLGGTVNTATVPGAGDYERGYSTTTHEFAHTIHSYGLSDDDRTKIQVAFDEKRMKPSDEDWVDGPRQRADGTAQDCYASMTVHEYFAQGFNCYVGTNAGNDPYTSQPRHNDRAWLRRHEPVLHTIIERVAGSARVTANMPSAPGGDGVIHAPVAAGPAGPGPADAGVPAGVPAPPPPVAGQPDESPELRAAFVKRT